jgi:hypothetical protein
MLLSITPSWWLGSVSAREDAAVALVLQEHGPQEHAAEKPDGQGKGTFDLAIGRPKIERS